MDFKKVANQSLAEFHSQSQQDKDSAEFQFQVEQKKLQLQSDLLSTKQSLQSKEKELKNAIYNMDSTQKISDLITEVEGFERGVELINTLLAFYSK